MVESMLLATIGNIILIMWHSSPRFKAQSKILRIFEHGIYTLIVLFLKNPAEGVFVLQYSALCFDI